MAKDFKSFCESHYDQRWKGLQTYVGNCKHFIDQGTEEARRRIQERQEELRSTYDENEAEQSARHIEQLKNELQAFDGFETERRKLVSDLWEILNDS